TARPGRAADGKPPPEGRRAMAPRTRRVTLNGTGFAANSTAACYGLIPHRNGVAIELAGVTSGRFARAEAFARAFGIARPYASHAATVAAARPDIDNLCCANHAHGPYVREAARGREGDRAGEAAPPLAGLRRGARRAAARADARAPGRLRGGARRRP